MSEFDLKDTILTRLGENYDLHDKYVNRTLVKVQRTIGFDKIYARAEGAYLYDLDGKDYLDFLSGYSVFNIGRNHPTVQKAIRDVLELDLPNMVQMDCSVLSGLLGGRRERSSPSAPYWGGRVQGRREWLFEPWDDYGRC